MLRSLAEVETAFADAKARVGKARTELAAVRNKVQFAEIAEREAYGAVRQALGELLAHPSMPVARAVLLRSANGDGT